MKILRLGIVLSMALLNSGCEPPEPVAPRPAPGTVPRVQDITQQWVQSTSFDRMRGTQAHVSTLGSRRQESEEGQEQMFVSVSIPSTGGAPKVTLKIDRGQFHCGPRVCDLFISFNSGPAAMFVFERPRDGRGYDQLDSRESERLLGSLRSAARFAVEADLISLGTRQFFFEAEPLK